MKLNRYQSLQKTTTILLKAITLAYATNTSSAITTINTKLCEKEGLKLPDYKSQGTKKMETKTKNFILYNLDAPLVLHAFLKFSQIMIRINESTLEL